MNFWELQLTKEMHEVRLRNFIIIHILIMFLAFAQNVPDFVRIIVHMFNS